MKTIILNEIGEPTTRAEAKQNIGSLVHKIGYRYCVEMSKALGGSAPQNMLLLREGAGKVLIQRLKKYGTEEVVRRLKLYIDSNKAQENPRLTAALSGATYTAIEMDKLK